MPNVHYSFTGDAQSLVKAADEGLQALANFEKSLKATAKASGVEFDSKIFDTFSEKVLNSLSGLTLLQKQFKEFSKSYGSLPNGGTNVIDQMIQRQNSLTKSARESAAVFQDFFRYQESHSGAINGIDQMIAQQNRLKKSAKESADVFKAYFKEQESGKTKTAAVAQQTDKATKSTDLFKNALTKLRGTVDKFTSSMSNMTQQTKSASNGLSKIVQLISGAAIGKALASATESSINYVENLNLFKVAMHDSVEEGQKFIATMSEMYGLDPSYLAKTTGLFYEMAYAVDVPADAASKLSLNLTALSSDIASLFNVDFEQAADNMTSGIRGMSRAVVKYGLDLRASTVEAYANAHGITEQFETMNEASREILRYLVALEQASDAAGDFAKTINSPANQLRIFKEQIIQFGRAIGNFFVAPIATALPYVTGFVMAIRTLLEGLAELLGLMTWTSASIGDVSSATSSASSGISSIGSAASNATKQINKMLAPFDELNVISEEASSAAGGVGGSIGTTDMVDPKLLELLDQSSYKLQDVKLKANDVRDAILEFMGISVWKEFDEDTGRMITRLEYIPEVFENNLISKFPNWKQSIQALFDVNWDVAISRLQFIATLIGDIAKMTLGNVVQDIMTLFNINDETVSAFIKNINDNLQSLGQYLTENYDTIVNWATRLTELGLAFGVVSTAAGILGPSITTLATFFKPLDSALSSVKKVVEPVITSMGSLGDYMLQTQLKGTNMVGTLLSSLGSFSSFFTTIFSVGIIAAIALIVAAFANWLLNTESGQQTLQNIFSILGDIFKHLGEAFVAVVKAIISAVKSLTSIFDSVFSNIGGIIENFLGMLDGVLEFIAGAFSGDWKKAWNGIGKIVTGAMGISANFVGGVFNTLITLLENFLNFVGDAFLSFAKSLVSKIPIFGSDWADDIPSSFNITLPKLPKFDFNPPEFATGGVVTSPTYSLIGEAGRDEAVIPLDNSPQMLDFIEKIADRVGNNEPQVVKVYIGDKEWDTFTYQSAQRGEKLTGAQQVKVSK